eukprot:268761-Amphidinium_carterae.1
MVCVLGCCSWVGGLGSAAGYESLMGKSLQSENTSEVARPLQTDLKILAVLLEVILSTIFAMVYNLHSKCWSCFAESLCRSHHGHHCNIHIHRQNDSIWIGTDLLAERL